MYSPRLVINTCAGSGIKDEYQLRITEDGEDLVKTGQSDLYEYIQSHADSVDIHKILERCAMIQDYSILNRMPADFMDVTEMPKNLAQAHAAVKDAENYFMHLPLSMRQEYDNSFTNFLQDLGSDHFMKVCKDFVDGLKTPDIEVKEDVNNES